MEWIRHLLREKRFDIWLAVLLAFVAAVIAEVIVEVLITWGFIPGDVLIGLRTVFIGIGHWVVRYPLSAAIILFLFLVRWILAEVSLRGKHARPSTLPEGTHGPSASVGESTRDGADAPKEPVQPRWVTPVLLAVLLISFGILVQLRVAHASVGRVVDPVEGHPLTRVVSDPICSDGVSTCTPTALPKQREVQRSSKPAAALDEVPAEAELERLVIEQFTR